MGTGCSGTSGTRDSPRSPSPPSKNRLDGTRSSVSSSSSSSSSSVSSSSAAAAAVRSADNLPFVRVRVRLSLLDASGQARDDPRGLRLRRCLRNERCWNDACSANAFLARAVPIPTERESTSAYAYAYASSPTPNGGREPTPADIRREVSRFLRVRDQYLARASMLFKSRAFHEVYNERTLRALGPGESFVGDSSDSDNDNDNDEDSVGEGTGGTIRRRRGRPRPRPIVELPRTAHRKPYVPLPARWRSLLGHVDERGDGNDNENQNQNQNETDNAVALALAGDVHRTTRIREEDVFSFSISHQFPFVGMADVSVGEAKAKAKAKETKTTTTTAATATETPPRVFRDRLPPLAAVGLDIVVFEKLNARLYSSHDEFLDVFRDQFTANEWERRIRAVAASATAETPAASSSSIVPPSVTEFYLRWAMKEAYTKALGVGMGLSFGSFEILLEGIDRDDRNGTAFSGSEPLSLWELVVRRTAAGIGIAAAAVAPGESSGASASATSPATARFDATVRFARARERRDERARFFFAPLRSSPSSEPIAEGCACVCVASVSGARGRDYGDDGSEPRRLEVSWTDLEALTRFHDGDSE